MITERCVRGRRLCDFAGIGRTFMLGMIIGKTKDEALRLGNLFLRMIKGEASDEEIDERRGRLVH